MGTVALELEQAQNSGQFTFSLSDVVEKCVQAVIFEENFVENVEIYIKIVDSAEIQEINRQFRQLDKPTDVLSFPMMEKNPDTGHWMLGDVLVNAERVIAQAAEYGHSEEREFAFLVTHSLLHLFGYDHETEEEETEMRKKQSKILQKIGYVR